VLPVLFSPGYAADTIPPAGGPGAILLSGEVRFAVLTPQLLRLEWAADSSFKDRASLAILNRTPPVPKFSIDRKGGCWN
jgi:hypothetical protein